MKAPMWSNVRAQVERDLLLTIQETAITGDAEGGVMSLLDKWTDDLFFPGRSEVIELCEMFPLPPLEWFKRKEDPSMPFHYLLYKGKEILSADRIMPLLEAPSHFSSSVSSALPLQISLGIRESLERHNWRAPTLERDGVEEMQLPTSNISQRSERRRRSIFSFVDAKSFVLSQSDTKPSVEVSLATPLSSSDNTGMGLPVTGTITDSLVESMHFSMATVNETECTSISVTTNNEDGNEDRGRSFTELAMEEDKESARDDTQSLLLQIDVADISEGLFTVPPDQLAESQMDQVFYNNQLEDPEPVYVSTPLTPLSDEGDEKVLNSNIDRTSVEHPLLSDDNVICAGQNTDLDSTPLTVLSDEESTHSPAPLVTSSRSRTPDISQTTSANTIHATTLSTSPIASHTRSNTGQEHLHFEPLVPNQDVLRMERKRKRQQLYHTSQKSGNKLLSDYSDDEEIGDTHAKRLKEQGSQHTTRDREEGPDDQVQEEVEVVSESMQDVGNDEGEVV